MYSCSRQTSRAVEHQRQRRGVSGTSLYSSKPRLLLCRENYRCRVSLCRICFQQVTSRLFYFPAVRHRLVLFQKAFKKGCTPLTVSTGTRLSLPLVLHPSIYIVHVQGLCPGLTLCVRVRVRVCVCVCTLSFHGKVFTQCICTCTCTCMCILCLCPGFHGLVYDLLRRSVVGELEAEETAAFFTDLASNLVRTLVYLL